MKHLQTYENYSYQNSQTLNEGAIVDKIKSYAKKGILTTAVVASLMCNPLMSCDDSRGDIETVVKKADKKVDISFDGMVNEVFISCQSNQDMNKLLQSNKFGNLEHDVVYSKENQLATIHITNLKEDISMNLMGGELLTLISMKADVDNTHNYGAADENYSGEITISINGTLVMKGSEFLTYTLK